MGIARIEDVFAAESATVLADLMDPDPPVIRREVGEEIAAWKAVRHGESALAVVDDDRRFVGLIPPRRIVEVLLTEHDEDLARLGGYLASTSSARHATEEDVSARLGHRLPWLLVGLAARSLRPASWVPSSASSIVRCSSPSSCPASCTWLTPWGPRPRPW